MIEPRRCTRCNTPIPEHRIDANYCECCEEDMRLEDEEAIIDDEFYDTLCYGGGYNCPGIGSEYCDFICRQRG